MLWVFWSALAFLAYTFAGYPLLLWALVLVRGRTHRKAPIGPKVSLIIAAYNEAPLLREKIANSLALAYPQDKLEIIVASDGSEDETAEIVRSYPAVKLVDIPQRQGKHYAQMMARDVSSGEILVFTDASVHLESDGLAQIVSNFADESVGCVSSEDAVSSERHSRIGEGFYIRLEMWLRRLESRLGSLVGVSGSFFAARRELCQVWHPHQSSDFFVALHAVARHLRAVVDPACRGHYRLARSQKSELQRKVRTIVHGLDVFFSHVELLNPLRYGLFSWQLVSHKMFRWLAPFAVLALLVSNLFLWQNHAFYRWCLLAQVAVYGFGALALAVKSLGRFGALKLAGFFLVGNAATVVAWFKFFAGERFVIWQPTRRG